MRDNLAAHIADQLRQSVADGLLVSGERINEVALAEELEVSRTPLREALYLLTADGFVENRPRRGFFVQRLDAAAVRQLYQMRSILDPAALELAGIPGDAALDRLEGLNGAIVEARGDVERTIDLDDAWHMELVGGCPNRLLLELIRQFMARTRPLERAFVRQHHAGETMVGEHAKILRRLRGGDLEAAVAALRGNMESGLEPILRWMEEAKPTAVEMRR